MRLATPMRIQRLQHIHPIQCNFTLTRPLYKEIGLSPDFTTIPTMLVCTAYLAVNIRWHMLNTIKNKNGTGNNV